MRNENDSIETQVFDIIHKVLLVPFARITNDATLESLGADEVDHEEMFSYFEDLIVDDDLLESDARKWQTVGDIVAFFKERLV
jgi:acyl carrier protein